MAIHVPGIFCSLVQIAEISYELNVSKCSTIFLSTFISFFVPFSWYVYADPTTFKMLEYLYSESIKNMGARGSVVG
jgi:hypothetical protein